MAMQPIKLPPGVVKAATPSRARDRYWDANLIRWRGDHLLPVGGWQRNTAAPLPEPVRRLFAWRDLKDIFRIVLGSDGRLQILEGSTVTDITPVDFNPTPPYTTDGGYGTGPYDTGRYGTPRPPVDSRLFARPTIWSLDNFGANLLALSGSDGRLLLWDTTVLPLPARAAPVAAAPANAIAMVVTEERHVMLFGAGGVPYRVAWCSREDINDWDFASTTNTAGFFDLSISGFIVNAVRVRGGVLIFTDADVWLARYIGQPFVYSFERIGEACSLYGPLSVAGSGSTAIWMGRQTFWIFDGGTVRPLPCDVANFLFAGIDEFSGLPRVHAAVNGLFPEAWFFYPSKGQTECDRYVIWNWQENWWSVGALARSAMLGASVAPYPVMAGTDGHIFEHEKGWTAAGMTRVGQVWAETANIAIAGGDRRVEVQQVQFDSGHGFGATRLLAFAKDMPDGAEHAEGPFLPGPDGWTDCRFSGRDIRLRVEAARDEDWSLGELRLDAQPGAGR
jgi:hypothetical protein